MKYLLLVALISSVAIAETRSPASSSPVVRRCDDKTPVSVENYEDHKTFSNGNVRMFVQDTFGEPACCSNHLVISIKNKDEPSSTCFHIASNNEGHGFNRIQLARARTSYNATSGLTVELPISTYNPDNGAGNPRNYRIQINQANTTVTIR